MAFTAGRSGTNQRSIMSDPDEVTPCSSGIEVTFYLAPRLIENGHAELALDPSHVC